VNDDQRFRQIFLMLDSDQAGERESALGRLHALRSQAHWPSFGEVLEASESRASEGEIRLATENAELRAQNERLRSKITRSMDLFEAAVIPPPGSSSIRWLRTAVLALAIFLATGYQHFISAGENSVLDSIQ